jgi:hypothetical protein
MPSEFQAVGLEGKIEAITDGKQKVVPDSGINQVYNPRAISHARFRRFRWARTTGWSDAVDTHEV